MKIYNRAKQYQQDNDNYEEIDDSQYQTQQPPISPQRQYQHEQELGFGDTRDPTALAKSVERNPTPHGIGRLMIGGRPIDLHMFEDYMVWKISPYQLRTVLRYRNARMMEEMKNYSSVPVMKLKFGTIMLIILAVGMGVVGLIIMTMMPGIMEAVKGIF